MKDIQMFLIQTGHWPTGSAADVGAVTVLCYNIACPIPQLLQMKNHLCKMYNYQKLEKDGELHAFPGNKVTSECVNGA